MRLEKLSKAEVKPCFLCIFCSEFDRVLSAYKYAVTTTGQIAPAPGMHVVDDLLNTGAEGPFITAFVPNDEAVKAFRQSSNDVSNRYTSMLAGSEPKLLQKVDYTMVPVIPPAVPHASLLTRVIPFV